MDLGVKYRLELQAIGLRDIVPSARRYRDSTEGTG